MMMSLLVLNEILIALFGRLRKKYGFLKYVDPTQITTAIGLIAGLILNYVLA
jgi:hypothetical protein